MADAADTTTRSQPSLSRIGSAFTRYANFTLGGGSATIAVLHRELVDKQQWVSSDDFSLCFAIARLTPGASSCRQARRVPK
jgi:chromate transporter